MIKQNCEIIINNGIITSIKTIEQGITISIDHNKYFYKDAFVIPTFTDSHCHIWGLGMKTLGLYFDNCRTPEECVIQSINHQFKRGDWLIGRGWNDELWNGQLPNKNIIDKYYPNIPVCFIRVDGHCMWVNSKALELADITYDTQIDGGEICLDSNNHLTGLLIDNAMTLIEKIMPKFTDKQMESFVVSGLDQGSKSGIMKFHDMDVNESSHRCFINLDKEGLLQKKVYSFLTAQNEEYLDYYLPKYNGNNYKVQGIKLYADGALGSRGAFLHHNYNDWNTNGIELMPINQMFKISEKASKEGYDIAIHAIGDKAVSNVIEVYKRLRNQGFDNNLRIEHSQLIQPFDIELFHKYNIIASVQPTHCISDAYMADKRLGKDRARQIAYKWKSLIDNQVTLVAGSDFPIESESVILGLQAFTHRIPFNSTLPWNKEEIITLDNALKSYIELPQIIVNNKIGINVDQKSDILVLTGEVNKIDTWRIKAICFGNVNNFYTEKQII